MKKFITIGLIIIFAFWIGYRVYVLHSEAKREVFNQSRVEQESGVPVNIMFAREAAGVLREPLAIKNNRAYVSGARVGKFGVGQKVGDGRIIFVSQKIDLDTGMYEIRTEGSADGEQFAEAKYTGFFIPLYSVIGGKVMIAVDGVATAREVKIAGQDAETVLVSRGLEEGDTVILSKVVEGDKVQVNM